MAKPDATRSALLEEALGFGGPIIVFDMVNLAFDEKVILRNVSFTLQTGHTKIFLGAGAEWRGAGCSMCLGMNPDQLAPGERSASTSNRNFEGRQGRGGRTHLVSPVVAAATAVTGHLSSPSDLPPVKVGA